MARGQPDYQGVLKKTEVVLSPSHLFPTGRVIVCDNFDSPSIRFAASYVGSGSTNLSTSIPFKDYNCLEMKTGSSSSNISYASWSLGAPKSLKVGCEISFALASTSSTLLIMWLRRYDGTTQYQAYIYYSQASEGWYYKNSDGDIAAITGGSMALAASAGIYHRMKLIVDYSAGTFISLQVNETLIDMSSISLYSAASASDPYSKFDIAVQTAAASAKTVKIGNVLITEED